MMQVPSRMTVIAGSGSYPRLVIEGAHRAGVRVCDVCGVRGSVARATKLAADHVHEFGLGEIARGVRWLSEQNYEGVVFAGQVSPLSLFRTRFDVQTRAWLASLSCKCAHTIYGKLSSELEKVGVHVWAASSFMEAHLPGVGVLTTRKPSAREEQDFQRGLEVMADVGRHDVGQTVLVKDGMVLAVEAFEGTNAAIKRGGKLGGKGAVVVKGARDGHDMRFDIPVIGLKTVRTMHAAGVEALAFQAHRLILLEKDDVLDYANRKGITLVGLPTSLPPAPTRPHFMDKGQR